MRERVGLLIFNPIKKCILIKNFICNEFAEGDSNTIRYSPKVVKYEYVLLLNNDTVVDRTFPEELVDVAENSYGW